MDQLPHLLVVRYRWSDLFDGCERGDDADNERDVLCEPIDTDLFRVLEPVSLSFVGPTGPMFFKAH